MGRSVNDAAAKGAQILLYYVEECATSMGRRANYAVVMGAHNMLRREECAPSMVLMSSTNDAAQ